jgi:D-alanine--(R)-lactate ligase
MARLRIGVLFGGCSEEHFVSVKSAIEVAKSLDSEKYEPFYIGITKSGKWKLCAKPSLNWEDGECCNAVLSPDRAAHGLLVFEDGRIKTVRLDLAFPAMHGKLGEDGSVQGLLELSGIPYMGCDVQSSVLCMDKSLAYAVAKSAGIPTPAHWISDNGEAIGHCSFPLFVKPARSGSSFGVSKVEKIEDLRKAVIAARKYDHKVLVEEAVPGIEIGCAVIEDGDELLVGEVDQITLSHGFFRIHQEADPEQGSENAAMKVPADISDELGLKAQETARRIFRALGCKGLARVDMFLKGNGEIVLNEVNTMPGLTSYSRFPKMMSAAGLSLAEVIDRIATTALRCL